MSESRKVGTVSEGNLTPEESCSIGRVEIMAEFRSATGFMRERLNSVTRRPDPLVMAIHGSAVEGDGMILANDSKLCSGRRPPSFIDGSEA